MSIQARAYWLAIIGLGAILVASAMFRWNLATENVPKFALYLLAAVGTSRLKVRLPGVFGTLSVNYVFIFLALLDLQFGSAVLIVLAGTIVQSVFFAKQRPIWEQVLFNVFALPLALFTTNCVLTLGYLRAIDHAGVLSVLCGSTAYYLMNTAVVAVMIGLTTKRSPFQIWHEAFLWTAPQYVVGGSIAALLHLMNKAIPWQVFLLGLPPIYLIYRSYTQYLGRVEEQQKHIADMARLHWRTIEALALAIQAKDDTTASHLKRVQIYATEVARELQLSAPDMRAIEAAAMLHDIGKLAVPEYIISKPGRLTPEEFEKMKIHPVVGAEILERVDFPYPVVPIVRSHHEKFDGSGYPDGLKGEEIPIGARVIAAVDCLDALASHRQYRPALPLDEAMQVVIEESGRSFDPQVVKILASRYREMEAKAIAESANEPGVKTKVKSTNQSVPGAGLASSGESEPSGESFTSAIASARRELRLLMDSPGNLEATQNPEQGLALLAARLEACVPHDALVFYVRKGDYLKAQYVKGESSRLFASLNIPVGQGLSGWVAENNLPIVNGNPAVEPGYLNDPHRITSLRSGLAMPLLSNSEVVGVLSLYSFNPDTFNQDHLRVLQSIQVKAGMLVANLLRFTELQYAAETDELTGLMNAGALFRVLPEEVAHAERNRSALVVVMLDLDGFKAANDRHGHLTGNKILQNVGAELKLLCRKSDYVGRLGGDEFVLILKDVTEYRLLRLLDQMEEIGPRASEAACGEGMVTISVGTAWYPDDGKTGDELLETADKKMYEAKRQRKARAAARVEPAPSCA